MTSLLGFYLKKDQMPSLVFKKFLILKIEKSICKILENENCEQVFDTVCLCFDDNITYFTPLEDDYGNHYIRVSLKHKSSWMGIGHAYIIFHKNGNEYKCHFFSSILNDYLQRKQSNFY